MWRPGSCVGSEPSSSHGQLKLETQGQLTAALAHFVRDRILSGDWPLVHDRQVQRVGRCRNNTFQVCDSCAALSVETNYSVSWGSEHLDNQFALELLSRVGEVAF